jgi:outer membrane protein OmpA-like peptidoglycan-associated protein
VGCINDAACVPGKDKWFNFDNLNFETNSAKITAESQAQVNNIAAILKAFPKAKIKIGGYTDKSGDAAANKKLSQERADAVTAAVIAAGANKDQLEKAEGYGSEFATVDAKASDAERKVDRKISVSLRAK